MSLPAFMAPGSPPRSPHGSTPGLGLVGSFFPAGSTSNHNSSRALALRPTRRDIILCLLTLSFAYLLFSQPPTLEPVNPPSLSNSFSSSLTSSSSKFKLPSWSYWSHSDADSTCATSRSSLDITFGESVKPVMMAAPGGGRVTHEFDEYKSDGKGWDGGEEMEEDDELQSVETFLVGHQPGWTFMERVYVYNGSLYVVTDNRKDWPELIMMTSTGLPALPVAGNGEARRPKGHEIIFITPFEAVALWGPRVYRMEGMTWLWNDGQFIDHYYHFAAELLLGTWRTYATQDPDIAPTGETKLAPPKRMWFLHQNANEWRDSPRFNSLLTSCLFPSTAMLYPQDWADLTNITISYKPKAFLLDKAILADRSAAFYGPYTTPTSRTVASAIEIGTTSRWFWEPIRRQVLRYAGVSEEIISRNLEGFGAVDPAKLGMGNSALGAVGPGISELEPLAPKGNYKPVVTYISRQSSRRRLTAESHAELVKALEERSIKVGFELVIVEAEKMSKEEQFALAGRTTIMLGVHGNGLTHLLWMPATPRSAVIELYFKGGFARDYQWTAQTLGIRHFGVQHDNVFTAPDLPEVAYPEGFQGTSITVDGKTIADLIEDRLAGRR